MNLADRMDEALTDPTAIVMHFSQRAARLPNDIYIFVEDLLSQSTFTRVIYRIMGRSTNVYCYPCKNKRDVLDIRADVISTTNDSFKFLFFVDRDHDDIMGNQQMGSEDLLVTEKYSIENYSADPAVMEAFLMEGFCHSFGASFTMQVLDQFRSSVDNFYKLMRPMMLFCIASKRKSIKIRYNNVDLKNVFGIDQNLSIKKKKNGWNNFRKAACDGATTITLSEMRSAKEMIVNMREDQLIRGKFVLWLVSCFLEKTKEIMRANHVKGARSEFNDIDISEFSIMDRYVDTMSSESDIFVFVQAAMFRFDKA